MDGGGRGGGSGSGTTPTKLAAAMRHMLPVDEDDYDCTIELALSEVEAAGAGSEASGERPAKRAKQGSPGPAAAPAVTKCRASSVALKQHSEVFRRWIKGWAGEQGQQERTLRIACEDEEEVEAFQQLLGYIHSAGRTLPDDVREMIALLTVARKHAAEACVDACLQLLLGKAAQLPLQACLRLALLLETGASPKEDVQAQSDQLMQRISERLQVLVKDEAAAVLADAALLEAVASFFGRWHAMLNCAMRRKVWLALPFELLQTMFEDRHVHADTEATVLGAFAFWADTNVADEPLAPEDRQRIATVCSRIRFPQVPPDVLINYWDAFQWLQHYDPDKGLLLRALATAADAQQRTLWQASLSDPPRAGDEADAAALAAVQADCRLWWTPHAPALVSDTNDATFELQVDRPPGTRPWAASTGLFWLGYWWRGVISKIGHSVGIFTMPPCSARLTACKRGVSSRLLYRTKAQYGISLQLNGAEASFTSLGAFPRASMSGWGRAKMKDSSDESVIWERLWAADSPCLRGGRALLRLTLSVPPS